MTDLHLHSFFLAHSSHAGLPDDEARLLMFYSAFIIMLERDYGGGMESAGEMVLQT
ncbi:unnamed protein product [Amoebophrya sp. A120]|nr:unnamed protein product [Amoebophrya sp. A120]|eukprot:GSA120T00025190001.1